MDGFSMIIIGIMFAVIYCALDHSIYLTTRDVMSFLYDIHRKLESIEKEIKEKKNV